MNSADSQSQLRTPGVLIFSLLMIVQQVNNGAAQVTAQQCRYNMAHTIANCSSRQLVFVPWHLHKSIITLDLSGNYFPTVENQSFISYNYINQLYLANNSIQKVEARAFHMLNFLTTLDLANNKLSHIPSSSLEPIARTLLQLILSGNKIQVLPKGIFQNFVRLQLLDLSGNSIFRIEYGAFKGLQSMQELKIRHNALSFLPPDSFDDFTEQLNKVQLYDNRWFCDCKIRWLRQWLNNTNSEVWDSKGYNIRCDGPSIVREKTLSSLSMDELACEVQMKTSSSTRELTKGANITLLCKYTSIPEAEARWLRNSEVIDVHKYSRKYSVETSFLEVHRGEKTLQSELKIRDFNYKDIAKYVCFVQNIRSIGSTEYKLTLEGVAFDSVTPASSERQASNSGVDTRSIVIAVGIVCGIILVIVISVLIFCSINRVQRQRQAKHDAIVENVKQHFINNSEAAVCNGDISGLNDTKANSKSMDTRRDCNSKENRPICNNITDSKRTMGKPPPDLNETEPLYIFQHPESPFDNGNTYVSFGSELTDQADFRVPHPEYSHAPSSRYESSHAGSATPLLDRYTPSVFDSDEPAEDYAHYPVYDSLTNSIRHPHQDGIYRNDSSNGNNSYHNSDGTKRLSSFYYPSAINGFMPQAPGNTCSKIAYGPRYADFRMDRKSPPDMYGAATPLHNDYCDYPDYHDMMYPDSTPPPHLMTSATKKSMSVGNLGFTPLSAGPRKPPRLYQSREYMELTPQETDFITSPEARRYSQNYGITPGTPV